MDRTEWQNLLERKEQELSLKDGFKFLYGPWSSLTGKNVAFLSLNPGRAPDDAELRVVSDERGNSDEVEKFTTRSPITDQFLKMAEFVNTPPKDILTGVVAPFRCGVWGDLTKAQKQASLMLGHDFWSKPLRQAGLNLIVACSNEAAELACEVTGARFYDEFGSGWGTIKIRCYSTADGKRVIQLPHLSRFKLFGRPESATALERALRSVC